jgi:hypothetical protein
VYFVLLGKTDMFVLVKLFGGFIEHGTQVVGRILSTLGKPDGWLVALCMGRINHHALALLVSFLEIAVHSSLAWVMLLSRNRLSLLRIRCSVCLMCWRQAFFCCLRCSRGPGGMMVLLLLICCVRLSMSW